MFEHPPSESSWRRARDDTVLAFHTIKLWVVFVAWEGVLMFVPSLMTTVSISRWEFAGIQAGIFFGGMLILLGAVFLVSLLFAPYRQRNEARALLSAKPKLVPISNRNELIKAMNQVQEAAKAFIWKKEQLNQMSDRLSPVFLQAQNVTNEAYSHYQQVDKNLDEEGKVAGEAFQTLISSFQNLVKLDVWIRYYEHGERPNWSVVLTKFDNAVKRAVKTIDDISQ